MEKIKWEFDASKYVPCNENLPAYDKEECELIAKTEAESIMNMYKKLKNNPSRFKQFLSGVYSKVSKNTYQSPYYNCAGYVGELCIDTYKSTITLKTKSSSGGTRAHSGMCLFIEEVMNDA